MIHSSMKTIIDVARQTRKFYMQANLLLRNFRYCSDDVKCTLFQSYCNNMYCCKLWSNSMKSSLIKLSTSYNSVLVSAVYIFRFHNGVYLAIYTCLFRWCYGHFYNRLTQFIVYCSYVVCTILLRRPVDLSTHWTVTAISLHVTTFVGVCHE